METDTFTLNNPAKTGYTFLGWSGTGFSGTRTNVTIPKGSIGNREYTANWIARIYVVQFESNGGSTVDDQTIAYASKVFKPDDPTKAGYALARWYRDADLTFQWDFRSDTVTADMVLFAKWTTVDYSISYQLNGGTVDPPNQEVYTVETDAFTLNNPAKTGYIFDGWSGMDITDTSVIVTIPRGSMGNREYTAHWTANTYTVGFNAQEDSSVDSPLIVTFGAQYGLLPETARTGYTFDGWFTETNGNGTKITSESCVSFAYDHALYAGWTANTYKIHFDAQGGSTEDDELDDGFFAVEYSSVYTILPSASRTGYTFSGWYTGINGEGTQITNSTTVAIASDHTLYAKWTVNTYTVAFDPQGGSPVNSIMADYNTAINPPSPPPVRNGYMFGGWYREPECKNPWDFDSNKVHGDTVLYAKWMYVVTFESQGGSAVASKTVKYDALITAPAPPTRSGYTFKGWFKEPGCTNTWNFAADRVKDNITLYAEWAANSYKITFDSQHGSAMPSAYVKYDAQVSKPANPVRTGYDFSGWFKESACANEWLFDADKMPAKNIILYAGWTPHRWDVTFESSGGAPVQGLEDVAYYTTIPAPLIPAKEHHTFKGWFKDPACKKPGASPRTGCPTGT